MRRSSLSSSSEKATALLVPAPVALGANATNGWCRSGIAVTQEQAISGERKQSNEGRKINQWGTKLTEVHVLYEQDATTQFHGN